jgi:hypothetical protein
LKTVRILSAAFLLASCAGKTWAAGDFPINPEARPAVDNPATRPANYQPDSAPYDWRKTMQPERPWFHAYDQSLVMKMFLAEKADGGKSCKVYLTFEQALEVIKRLDRITCGAPKIVYLVGWQYNGHDSKYPAWDEVNARLKRPEDATALESLRWLMREGRRYHTTVSLHINMLDAYEDSPLWHEYLARDIIAKGKDGKPLKGAAWGGQQSFQLSYAQEWETGYAKRRIDGLVRMLPELKAAHTIHIDAFVNYPPAKNPGRDPNFKGISPLLGYGAEQESAAMRKTFRYFRDYGIDLTSECTTQWRSDAHVGLQPMAWHYKAPAAGIPPKLYCGTPMQAEPEIKADPVKLPGLAEQFALIAAPQIWANHWRHDEDKNQPQAKDRVKILQGGDSCVPLTWAKDLSLVAYSRSGYDGKTWELPAEWKGVKSANLVRITPESLEPAGEAAIADGELTLTLKPGEEMMVVAK